MMQQTVKIQEGMYYIFVSGDDIVFGARPNSEAPSPWDYIKDYSQRDPRWGDKRYSSSGLGLFRQYGCLVIALASLASFGGYPIAPVGFAQMIDEAGAFDGNYLNHPSKVTQAFGGLIWHRNKFIEGRYTSYVNWRTPPADLTILAQLLEKYPVIVEVDFKEVTREIDQHFVLALSYEADPTGGIDDTLIIMDPWTGERTNILTDYFNPAWMRDGTMIPGQTKVSRTVTGLRVWEVV